MCVYKYGLRNVFYRMEIFHKVFVQNMIHITRHGGFKKRTHRIREANSLLYHIHFLAYCISIQRKNFE